MTKVFVGLSGGVDSAVSAAILKQQGYDVTGVFIKIWSPEFLECTWQDDRLDAMRAAVHIGFPFREIDLSEEYHRGVVEGMLRDYGRGITPNPDVLCNSVIKFGAFAEWAYTEGADRVATGHYARIVDENGQYRLLRGSDSSKDQSYFVYRLTEKQLPRVLFPVGDMKKTEVREAARKFCLPAAEKPDSQGLCFVGDVTLRDFLARFIALKGGDVLDTSGQRIGTHDGAALYTLGQRHGFSIMIPHESHFFVVAIDTLNNTITVSQKREDAARTNVSAHELSWVREPQRKTFDALAVCRYREKPIPARVHVSGDSIDVKLSSATIASPGQALVLYDGDVVLGGGIIH